MKRPLNASCPMWLVCLIIILPPALMAPVLIWPHYGLFSDAQQLIAVPKAVLSGGPDAMQPLLPLADGRWNPLFHGLSVLIYALYPDSPTPFFVMQLILLWASLTALAVTVHTVTRSFWCAGLSVLLLCGSSSIFENFYTLDKVEPRLMLCSALLFLLVFRRVAKAETRTAIQNTVLFPLSVTILSALAIFSKETGVYLVGSFGALLLASCIFKSLKAYRLVAFQVFVSTFLVFASYRLLFSLLSAGGSHNYTSYSLDAAIILKNISVYVSRSPELLAGLVICVINAVWIFYPLRSKVSDSNLFLLSSVSLAFLAYLAGITLWRWPADYYLLPAQYLNAVLIGCAAPYLLQLAQKIRRPVKIVAITFLSAAMSMLLLVRGANAVAIFAFDQVKDNLAVELAKPEYFGKRLIVPMSEPSSSEIALRLEYFINRSRPDSAQTMIFNFWELPSDRRRNVDRFAGNAWWLLPTQQQLNDVANLGQDIVIWSFGRHSTEGVFWSRQSPLAENGWMYDTLRVGDLILLPTGIQIPELFSARGLSMHSRRVSDLETEAMIKVATKKAVRSGIGLQLGWEILEVVKTQ